MDAITSGLLSMGPVGAIAAILFYFVRNLLVNQEKQQEKTLAQQDRHHDAFLTEFRSINSELKDLRHTTSEIAHGLDFVDCRKKTDHRKVTDIGSVR